VAGAGWFGVREPGDLLRIDAEIAANCAGDEPAIDVDCARLARQLRHGARMTVGLLPTRERVRVQPFATSLAFAISLLGTKRTLVLDPEQASRAPPASSEATLYAHVPARRVVTLVPFARAPVGAKFEPVKLMVRHFEANRASFGHVIVDLSGCRLPGELLGAEQLLDGIIVVAPAGRATAKEVVSMANLVPPWLSLGVVLIDSNRSRTT
jgi:hypothetical protein